MIKARRKYKIQSEINVIPFLDVLLVLLIIFMIIPSKFIQGFEVNLPSSTETINFTDNNKSFLTIEILSTGLYNIIFHEENIKNICINKLHSEIYNKIYFNPNIICLIAAPKIIKYDEVIRVLNLLSSIGVNSIGMITNPVVSLN